MHAACCSATVCCHTSSPGVLRPCLAGQSWRQGELGDKESSAQGLGLLRRKQREGGGWGGASSKPRRRVLRPLIC